MIMRSLKFFSKTKEIRFRKHLHFRSEYFFRAKTCFTFQRRRRAKILKGFEPLTHNRAIYHFFHLLAKEKKSSAWLLTPFHFSKAWMRLSYYKWVLLKFSDTHPLEYAHVHKNVNSSKHKHTHSLGVHIYIGTQSNKCVCASTHNHTNTHAVSPTPTRKQNTNKHTYPHTHTATHTL